MKSRVGDIYVSKGKSANTIWENISFSVEGCKSYFMYSLTFNYMMVTTKTGHVTEEHFAVEQTFLIVFMRDGFAED